MQTLIQKKIHKTIAEAEANIAQMVSMHDKKLSANLDIVRQQMEMAFKANKESSVELMQLWEQQIIEARVIKFDAAQLEELKYDAHKNIITLAQNNTEIQLKVMLKKITAFSKQANSNQCPNLVLLYAEQQEQIKQALKLIAGHEEKYTIIRKLRKQIKLTAFEKKVLNFNPGWFDEIY
jgi:hypothetical protein